MIIFASLIAFSIAIINHRQLEEEIKENNQFEVRQIEETVKYSLETIDKAYYFFDDETASRMRTNTNFLIDLYEKNASIDGWDFNALSEQLGMDIYFINEENIVTNSSLKSDIGMDFDDCCSTLAGILNERRSAGEFYHDGIDIEQDTGEIKKYSYMATPDKKYIIELGYNLEKGAIFNEFNFLKVIHDLEEKYPSIDEINVLNVGGLTFGVAKDEKKFPTDRRDAFIETLETGETTEVISKWNGTDAFFRYVAYDSDYDQSATQYKVIEIVYNDHALQNTLSENRIIFLLQLLLILFVTTILALIISKWFAKPVHMAFHDQLTGLKNRAAFEEDLHRLFSEKKGKAALFMLDLDNFKLANDYLGHDMGDKILQLVAKTIRFAAPKEDMVYRLGGDEFVVLLPMARKDEVEDAALKMLEELKETMERNKVTKGIGVTASMGIAIMPDHAEDIETLFSKADRAMYKSKDKGKNQYCIYSDRII